MAVVVPCFNDGATVVEAVNSVLGEARVDELVVVDDGSTDSETCDVFAKLERDGVRVVRRPNGGLGLARMTGVQATGAEYIFPLDADDRLVVGSIAQLARELDENRDLGVVWGDYRLFGDRSYVQETAATLDPWQIAIQNDLPASALFRRSALNAAGGWVLRGGYEDWDLWMAMAERGICGRRVPVVSYEYRIHGVRMLAEAARQHAVLYERVRNRHPDLFRRRWRLWRQSTAPLPIRLLLPAIFSLPIGLGSRRLLAGAVTHLAEGRGLRLLMERSQPPPSA